LELLVVVVVAVALAAVYNALNPYPTAFIGGPAGWYLAHPVSPDATSVDLIVSPGGQCGPSSAQGVVGSPTVVYAQDSITITVQYGTPGCTAESPPANDFPLTVQLTEPVGHRTLVAGVLP
jgi:hypothetical protein